MLIGARSAAWGGWKIPYDTNNLVCLVDVATMGTGQVESVRDLVSGEEMSASTVPEYDYHSYVSNGLLRMKNISFSGDFLSNIFSLGDELTIEFVGAPVNGYAWSNPIGRQNNFRYGSLLAANISHHSDSIFWAGWYCYGSTCQNVDIRHELAQAPYLSNFTLCYDGSLNIYHNNALKGRKTITPSTVGDETLQIGGLNNGGGYEMAFGSLRIYKGVSTLRMSDNYAVDKARFNLA